jgi:ketosteroid isomerase-like protein
VNKSALCLALACTALAGCAPGEQALPNEVTTAMETAFNRSDIEACANLYADDAEIIAEDAPVVRGRNAILAFFRDQVARDISFDTDTTVSIVSGDLAFEQGTYRVRDVRRGVDVEYGEFLNVWKRTDGEWKNYRSMFNTTQAPSVDVTFSPEDGTS